MEQSLKVTFKEQDKERLCGYHAKIQCLGVIKMRFFSLHLSRQLKATQQSIYLSLEQWFHGIN